MKNIILTGLMLFLLSGCGLLQKSPEQKTVPEESPYISVMTTEEEKVTSRVITEDVITRLSYDDKIQAIASVNDGFVAWTESAGPDPADRDVILFNLASKEKFRMGLEKEAFGNVIGMNVSDFKTVDKKSQQLPQLTGNYILWQEYLNNDPERKASYYYSTLKPPFEKKLLTEFSELFPFIDNQNNVYYTPTKNKTYGITALNLETGKKRSIPLDFTNLTPTFVLGVRNDKLYIIGISEAVPTGDIEIGVIVEAMKKDNKLLAIDINDGEINEIYDFGPIAAKKGEIDIATKLLFAVTNRMIVWAELDTDENRINIRSYDFIEQKDSTLAQVDANWSSDNEKGIFSGLKASDEYVAWAVTYSPVMNQNGLFAYNMKTGKTHNILEDSEIKLSWDLYGMADLQQYLQQLDGNRMVFPGYVGESDPEYKNVEMYLLELYE